MRMSFANPAAIAEAGQKYYDEKYREEYERQFSGKFVAIDVVSGKAFVADQPEEAIFLGRKDAASGIFHLIRIGSTGTFRVSHLCHAGSNWVY